MTREDLKKTLWQDLEFDYNGINCAFCPLDVYLLRYGEDLREYDNLDDVIDAQIFNGRALTEIADGITFT
jgi:hypothetical protein